MALTEPLDQIDGGPSDVDLLTAALEGEIGAFDAIYRRHHPAAYRVACSVAGSTDDASDAVADAFTRIFNRIREGTLLPDINLRAYLLTSARNAAIDQHRRNKRHGGGIDDAAVERAIGPSSTPADVFQDSEDAEFAAQAFADLPERWRSVLWLTEVEGLTPKETADLLGVSANNASQLATRARTRLRARYLQAHVRAGAVDAGCSTAVPLLGAYVAGVVSARDLATVDQHLAGCDACRARVDELEEVGGILRRIVVPIPFLVAGGIGGVLRGAEFTSEQVAMAQAAAAAGTAGAVGGVAAASSSGSGGVVSSLPAWGQATAAAIALALGAAGVVAVITDDGGDTKQPAALADQLEAPTISEPDELSSEPAPSEPGSPNGSGGGNGAVSAPSVDPDGSGTDSATPPESSDAESPDGSVAVEPPLPVQDPPDPDNDPEPAADPTVQVGIAGSLLGQDAGVDLGVGDGATTGATLGSVSVGDPVTTPTDDGLEVNTGGQLLPDLSLGLP
ncbi:MAG TPA: sigma-70 family RNA polymerase sigma factor [Acidimicrobiales bacterium]